MDSQEKQVKTDKLVIPTEVYSRVVGYLRPVRKGSKEYWHPGKVQEFEDRVTFKVPREIVR